MYITLYTQMTTIVVLNLGMFNTNDDYSIHGHQVLNSVLYPVATSSHQFMHTATDMFRINYHLDEGTNPGTYLMQRYTLQFFSFLLRLAPPRFIACTKKYTTIFQTGWLKSQIEPS